MPADGHSEDRMEGSWAQEAGEGPREGQDSLASHSMKLLVHRTQRPGCCNRGEQRRGSPHSTVGRAGQGNLMGLHSQISTTHTRVIWHKRT